MQMRPSNNNVQMIQDEFDILHQTIAEVQTFQEDDVKKCMEKINDAIRKLYPQNSSIAIGLITKLHRCKASLSACLV